MTVLSAIAGVAMLGLSLPVAAETIIGGIDLGITKDVDASRASSGDTLVYTLVATNYGEAVAREGYVTDVLPNRVTFVSVDHPACAHDAGVVECYFPLWLPITLDSVAAVKTITITVTVDDDAAGTLVNVARVEDRDPADDAPEDGNPSNDEDSALTDTLGDIGGTVFEDLNGNGERDAGEPGIPGTFIEVVPALQQGGFAIPTDANGMYLLTGLPPDFYSLTLIQSSVPSPFVLTTPGFHVIGILGGESVLSVDFGVMFTEEPTIDLELTKTASPSDFEGEPPFATTFTITVTNLGPDPATGVVVADILPADVSFVSWDPVEQAAAVGGAPDPVEVIWFPGDVAVGESKTLEIEALVSDFGIFTNVAEVRDADQTDIDSTPADGEGDDYAEVPVGSEFVLSTGTIGDTVFFDVNNNGVQDSGESGISGATVTLTSATDTKIATTDASGAYLFVGLPAGDYTITVDQSSVGDNLGITTAASFLVSLADGENFTNADFGFTPILPATGLAGDVMAPLGLVLLALGAVALRTRGRRRQS